MCKNYKSCMKMMTLNRRLRLNLHLQIKRINIVKSSFKTGRAKRSETQSMTRIVTKFQSFSFGFAILSWFINTKDKKWKKCYRVKNDLRLIFVSSFVLLFPS